MGRNLVIIFLVTATISFVGGKLAGQKTMASIDASMSSLLKTIEVADEINSINSKKLDKQVGPKSLISDPQL